MARSAAGDERAAEETPHPTVAAGLWHGRDADAWKEQWNVPELRIFRSVGSTNDIARALAETGAPDGTVVLAEEQTRGRGRRGRPWVVAPGHGLLLSVVLRPRGKVGGVLPLRVGLAVAGAVEAVAGIRVGIKWPNDLVAGGRKLGGILCEGAVEGDTGGFVIAGIGINVLQDRDDWPPEIRGLATSLRIEAGRPIAPPALARPVIEAVSMAAAGGPTLDPAELEELARRDTLRGRDVTLDGRPAGRAAGMDHEGALILERAGETRRVTTGTIRPAAAGGEGEGDDA